MVTLAIASLRVRSRCLVVFDVIARGDDGEDAIVASGLPEAEARALYEAVTGQKWTRVALVRVDAEPPLRIRRAG